MPAGMPQHSRCSPINARIITLGPHAKTLKEILDLIIDDIVEGSTNGFDSFDPYGYKVKTFLDPTSFLADYVEMTANSAVAGHMAIAYCTLCVIFRRRGGINLSILHSINLHSRRMSVCRTDDKMDQIFSSRVTPDLAKHLGLSTRLIEDDCSFFGKIYQRLRGRIWIRYCDMIRDRRLYILCMIHT